MGNNNDYRDGNSIREKKEKIFEEYFKNLDEKSEDIILNKEDNIKKLDSEVEEKKEEEISIDKISSKENDNLLNNHIEHIIEKTDELEEIFKIDEEDDAAAKEISLLDGDKEEIDKELEKSEELSSIDLTKAKKSSETQEEYDIYEPIETEMIYSDEKGKGKFSKVSAIFLIVAAIVAVFGITFALFAVVDSSKLSAFRYKVDGYEIPTIMGFLEKEGKAVDYKKGIAEDVNGRYAIYLYSIDDFDYESFNKYVEHFMSLGYEAYTISDGAIMLYKFVDDDVLNLTFYPYDNFMEVTFTVYDYVEEDFAWMEELDELEEAVS